MDIMKEIDRRIVFWDGGMGSLLQERGLQPGELPGDMEYTAPGHCDGDPQGVHRGRCGHYRYEYLRGKPAEIPGRRGISQYRSWYARR